MPWLKQQTVQTAPMETLIFDTSAIFNFGHRGQLDFLLQRMASQSKLVTTPVVHRECCAGELKDYYDAFLGKHVTIKIADNTSVSETHFAALTGAIHAGEISVLLLAAELRATAVIDDRIARIHASNLGIKVIGTVGLINNALGAAWLTDDQCLEIIKRLRDARFRLPRPGANQTFVEYVKSLESL